MANNMYFPLFFIVLKKLHLFESKSTLLGSFTNLLIRLALDTMGQIRNLCIIIIQIE
jgi:hypothetical protein